MEHTAELALHRFGLGAQPGQIAGLAAPERWLNAQIAPQPAPEQLSIAPSAADVIRNSPDPGSLKNDPEARKAYQKGIRQTVITEFKARMMVAYTTETPFHERLVWFWANHLSVTATAKVRLAPFAVDYERTAIRPHVTGKFADMLLASARHPAMLIYLDNENSVGPNSIAGQKRDLGLNENYARELMELHTLGVGSGYTQTDIIELAKVLTGWTVRPKQFLQGDDPFFFVARRHEPGQKTVLGVTYDEGEKAGIGAITALARHPATAKRLAHKFAAHFTADTPDPALCAKLEAVYRDTDGDLGEMTRALVAHDAAWAPDLQKAREPIGFVTAAVRALSGTAAAALPDPAQMALLGALRTLGHIPFGAPSPQGWPDDVSSWFGPDQVVERVDWALALAGRMQIKTDPVLLAGDVLGRLLSDTTRTAIQRAPSPKEGLAMLVASPEFMRR